MVLWKLSSLVHKLQQQNRQELYHATFGETCSTFPATTYLEESNANRKIALVGKLISLSGGGIGNVMSTTTDGVNPILQEWFGRLMDFIHEDLSFWWIHVQEYIEDQFDILHKNFLTLPKIVQHILLLNLFVYLCWKILPSKFSTRHFTVSTQSIEEKRFYNFFISAFSHKELYSLLFNLSMFLNIVPDLIQGFGEHVLYYSIFFASFISHLLPLITDAFTRLIHRKRVLNKQSQSKRCYHGFAGVNVALSYLALTLKPDMEISMHNELFQRDFSVRTLFCALMTFDVLALFVDMFMIPSAQSIPHARDLGGLLAGILIKYILCQTTWGRQHLKWNSRFKFCRRFG
jgi:hypothetical protein